MHRRGFEIDMTGKDSGISSFESSPEMSGGRQRRIAVAGTSMKKRLTVYQKPTCTKCRTTLRLLKERGVEFEAINYFETHLTEPDLRALLKKLGLSAREILRKDEPLAKE